ncbi:MAG: hypothetical protein J6C19_15975 [Lachnospiraceae bacterium]|nr:hypothetical protein [Lachnospiraceae bacterium]MBO5146999.1 hypothetical protein [Lachnospiraceae bacterium]
MKVIVHDLQEKLWQELGMRLHEKDIVIGKEKNIADSRIEELMGSCGQLIIISRCVYGGFSPFIQQMFDRRRENFEPFLEVRQGQSQYVVNHENKSAFGLICCFYGDNITSAEEQSARIQSVLDGVALRARGVKVLFYDTADKLKQLNNVCV